MKKFICLCLCVGMLVANDNVSKAKEYDTLVHDMKNMKAAFVSTDKDIQSLNKKFDYIISKLQKQTVANSVANNEIQRLQGIITSLEQKIAHLEQGNTKEKQVVAKTTKALKQTPKEPLIIRNEDKKLTSFKLYDPKPKPVIVAETSLDKMDKIQTSNFSVQVGIFRKQKSLNNAKKMYEKIIDNKTNHVVFEHCSTCKNNDLTKVLINGFSSKLEAQNFVKSHQLKNSRIIDNRG